MQINNASGPDDRRSDHVRIEVHFVSRGSEVPAGGIDGFEECPMLEEDMKSHVSNLKPIPLSMPLPCFEGEQPAIPDAHLEEWSWFLDSGLDSKEILAERGSPPLCPSKPNVLEFIVPAHLRMRMAGKSNPPEGTARIIEFPRPESYKN
jgi:hypothetical protein